MKTTIVAEVGCNHNGSLDSAIQHVRAAYRAGADVVKFQRRTIPDAIPKSQWQLEKDTVWGRMNYLEYRRRLELPPEAWPKIHEVCQKIGIRWTASVWDEAAALAVSEQPVPYIKIPSGCVTAPWLSRLRHQTVVLSTGMSTPDEIDQAVRRLTCWPAEPARGLTVLQCTSVYPCQERHVNLRAMLTMRNRYGCQIGYSGHEYGTAITIAAVAMGAAMVERHFTLDRRAWSPDQKISLEPDEFAVMVAQIREVEEALGDGQKRLIPEELPFREKLRVQP